MHDVTAALAELGSWALPTLGLPLLAWTVTAVVVEGGLQWTRPRAHVALPLRLAVLVGLPAVLCVGPVLAALAPEMATRVSALPPTGEPLTPSSALLSRAIRVSSAPQAAPPLWPGIIGLTVALAGLAALAGLLRLAGALVRLRRVRLMLAPAGPDVASVAQAVQDEMGVRRPVAVRAAPAGTPPFTFGWQRPVVAVPMDLHGRPLRLALAHEMAHVRRGDFAVHMGERALQAVFGVHPLVRVLAHGLDLDRECAADAEVLARWPQSRRAYADLLLAYASLPAPALSVGAVAGARTLTSRLEAMTRTASTPARLRTLTRRGRVFGSLALILAFGLAATTAPPPPPASADATASAGPSPDRAATVEGIVTDADTGVPLASASVQVAGSTAGAATGSDGRYRLDAPDGDQTVVVSHAGYETRRVRLADGQRELNVALTTRNVTVPPDSARFARMRARAERAIDSLRALDPPAPTPGRPDVFDVVEQPPVLIGGLAGVQERVDYPPLARDAGIEGTVFVQFIVNEEGRVEDAVVVRTPHEMLGRAALEAVRTATFEPGRQRGEAVKVRYALPIRFVLPGEEDRGEEDRGPGGRGPSVL